jgi:membrane-bound lytic murein transglycosylase B
MDFKLYSLKNKEESAKFHTMIQRGLIHKRQYWIFVLILSFSSMVYCDDTHEIPLSYQTLIQRLSEDGFDSEYLSKLLTDSRAEFISELTRISLISRETPESYAQFLSPEAILLSKQFLQKNLKILRQMEKQFHVEKEVIVAILLVESRFGENIGKYRIIPTLASLATMDSPDQLQRNYLSLREINPEISYEWIEDLSKTKARWAYHELKCLLQILRHEEIDPLEVYGSYAGAMGMAQFIPSSYLAYAVSRKSFERWLLSEEEAIFSIGNYLKSNGWKENISLKKKKQVLWYYNRSGPYVETILQVARKMRNR